MTRSLLFTAEQYATHVAYLFSPTDTRLLLPPLGCCEHRGPTAQVSVIPWIYTRSRVAGPRGCSSRNGCRSLCRTCFISHVPSPHPRQRAPACSLTQAILTGMRAYVPVVSICLPLMTSEAERLSTCLLAIWTSSLETFLSKSFARFFIRL